MDTEKLEEYFKKFPGIGSRQAKRFVYFLLTEGGVFAKDLASLISDLPDKVFQCSECLRFFQKRNGEKMCDLCSDATRDTKMLLVVEKDIDLEMVKKSGVYAGAFFVLGGLLPILEKNPTKKIRIKELVKKIERTAEKHKLKEIILAFSLNAEGENTLQYVKKTLEPLSKKEGFTISTLGRGFSTGLELEYSDAETLENALKNRS